MGVEQVPPALSQHNDDVSPTVELNRSDEPLLTEASQVALARVARLTVVVLEVATEDNAERAHVGERARL